MDYLWTPWRFQYMEQTTSDKKLSGCIFCDAVKRTDDEETLVVYRGKDVFVILNRFPYTSGHVMIVPYDHVAELRLCKPQALDEMMELSRRTEAAFHTNYKPDGINLGMNLGRAAGAGVTGHLHLHMLPRWFGDSNFMTVVGETRVEPEDLRTTYHRMKKALAV
jgi:ATP adenylyltransferase